jgi:hypothetical protein
VNESQYICIENNPSIDNFNSTLEFCDLSDGGITSSTSLGTAPYLFELYQGPTLVSFNATGTFTGLQSGIYSLLVVDQIGCIDSVIRQLFKNQIAFIFANSEDIHYEF